MEKNNNIIIIDRISELPEFIVHHILSFLNSPAELVRSSVLSKKWFALTASFPILDFNIRTGYFKNNNNFFKYVAYTTSRFCEQNVNVHTFNLITSLKNPTEVDIIDRCIELILKKGVQVLVIDILNWPYLGQRLPKYRLPDIVLSAFSLTSLTIRNCELPLSLMTNVVKFKSLKKLELDRVCIDEEVIKCLATSCPLLEQLVVEFCHGFKFFFVYGHQNLQKVDIIFVDGLERIDIEAPNLCCLHIMSSKERKAPCMNLGLCKKLTTLYYFGYPSPTSNGLTDLSSNFPFLENLTLELPNECNNLKLSSHSLRTFFLRSQCDLEEIDMNTPNLISFVYAGRSFVPSAPLKSPRMECYPCGYVDSVWFQKLRRFLDKKNGFKELKLRICPEDIIDVEKLKVIQWQPYELEHVELQVANIKDLSVYEGVVDAILWCCHPKSLTLNSYSISIDFKKWFFFAKFTYEKLLQQEEDQDQGHTNIQIVLSSSSSAKMQFSNLDSLLTALTHDRLTPTITFIK